MTAMTSPSLTWSSGFTRISVMVPDTGASTGISIFIDSRMAIVSPSAIICPSSAGTCHTLAAISACTSTMVRADYRRDRRHHRLRLLRLRRGGAGPLRAPRSPSDGMPGHHPRRHRRVLRRRPHRARPHRQLELQAGMDRLHPRGDARRLAVHALTAPHVLLTGDDQDVAQFELVELENAGVALVPPA